MPLNGLGVRLIHLHFLPSAIYPCSQHSPPVVFVFLLRVSINKILWVTLVPLLSAPVFMCVFTCKCAHCGCWCEYFCLWLHCVSLLSSAHRDPMGEYLCFSWDRVVTVVCVSVTFVTDNKLLINKDGFVQWVEARPWLHRVRRQSHISDLDASLSSEIFVIYPFSECTQMSRRKDVICQDRCNLRLQIRIGPKMWTLDDSHDV